MIEKLKQWIKQFWSLKSGGIYYIGGADVLPPPLNGTQEQQALEALSAYGENARFLQEFTCALTKRNK